MAGKSAPFPPKNKMSANASNKAQKGRSQYFLFSIIFLKIKTINPLMVVGKCEPGSGVESFNLSSIVTPFGYCRFFLARGTFRYSPILSASPSPMTSWPKGDS